MGSVDELTAILIYPLQRFVTLLGSIGVSGYTFLGLIVSGIIVTMIFKLFFDRLG